MKNEMTGTNSSCLYDFNLKTVVTSSISTRFIFTFYLPLFMKMMLEQCTTMYHQKNDTGCLCHNHKT
jgi:hypothetical protein